MTKTLVIKEKLMILEEYINDLNEYSNIKYEKLISDKKLYRFLERTLQLSLEVIFDIGNHIITNDKLGNYESKTDIFKILASNNIIKENVADDNILTKFYNNLISDCKGTKPDMLLDIIKEYNTNLKEIFKCYKDYIS